MSLRYGWMYTVYEGASDWPAFPFVVRPFDYTLACEGVPLDVCCVLHDPAELTVQRDLFEQHGLVCLGRVATDDPVITECWI